MKHYKIVESDVEEAVLSWFEEDLGYKVIHAPENPPGELGEIYSERNSYSEVILEGRLSAALKKINSQIPSQALEEAVRKINRTESPSLVENNRAFHRYLLNGVPVEYQKDGRTVHDQVWLIDFENLKNNEWLVVNQFTVIENNHNRRPDLVVFVNGLPLAVIELKNPADINATDYTAFNQIQTYKSEIPSLFTYNEVAVVSDGIHARSGTITSDWDRFMPWRTIDGNDLAPKDSPQLEVLIKGIFDKKRFLDLIRYFVVFESSRDGILKKIAGYHQFFAVEKAVERTVQAMKSDKRIGVVWHTQGSGKSLIMTFYSGKIIQHPKMENPTLVILTDRNDLDDQLFETFAACQDILRQKPVQARDREDLQKLLSVASGGVIFTTIQKFTLEEQNQKYPMLSDRRNIIVIADEAHRSHYDFIDGLASNLRRALPNASFIGFTATPIEKADRSTPGVFGNYIDVYDITQSIEDRATVPIYYESRLAKLELKEEEKPRIDPEFEEVTEDQEESAKKKLRSKWSQLEALVGSEKRIKLVAKDIVEHFEKRLEVMDGKALMVGMSRRICVDLYHAIVKLRPNWHDSDDKKGFIKVVMTGSASDPLDWQQHIRDKERRRKLGDRFKDQKDPLKLVIVRDMWLTGFDVPCLHTMYFDKPMKGHGLMQAIARVNRVFKDKPGGLIVDYLGIAHDLKKALQEYSDQDREQTGIDQEEAVGILIEKYEVIKTILAKFDYSRFFTMPRKDRWQIIPGVMEHILLIEDGKNRFLKAVAALSRAFALAVPHEKALAIQDEVGFFQAVYAALIKNTGTDGTGKRPEQLDSAIRQIVSRAVASEQVIDVFKMAGVERPDISILSAGFLGEVKNLPYKNLAAESLRKLLEDGIKILSRRFLVQARTFSEMLEQTIVRYHNRVIDAVEVIEELIKLAKQMKEAHRRGEDIGLSDDELAFYDALETNDSAVKVLGDEALRSIARELVETVRNNATIDWTVRENIRARMRSLVRRILRKYGYPPDKEEKAAKTVLEQAELLCADWSESN